MRSEIKLSGCTVSHQEKKEKCHVDYFIIHNERMMSSITLYTPTWEWILDNLFRCHRYIGGFVKNEEKEGEILKQQIWVGRGSPHFLSQLIIFETGEPIVCLRIERVYYEISGEVKHLTVNVPFSLADCRDLKDFIEKWVKLGN